MKRSVNHFCALLLVTVSYCGNSAIAADRCIAGRYLLAGAPVVDLLNDDVFWLEPDVAGKGDTASVAIASLNTGVNATAVPRNICSYSATLNGTQAPIINANGQVIGRLHGVLESYVDYDNANQCTVGVTFDHSPGGGGSPFAFAASAVVCTVSSPLVITLTGVTEGKPRFTANWRELALTAKVTQNGTPIAGKSVSYKLTAKAGPDGHDHSNLFAKPVGSVAAGVTNAAGELRSAYLPSEFSGIYTLEATCGGCSNKATLDVVVRVPDLVELMADTDRPPAYTLVGETPAHSKNHLFTVSGREALRQLIERMSVLGWSNPGINDASLAWGGRFDIGAGWGGSHAGHREGEEVDISFLRPNFISLALRKKTYEELAKGNLNESPQVLWHQFDNPETGSKAHFHIYLLSQRVSSTIPF